MEEKIAIIGVGHVGLPLSLAFAEAGFKVYGIDIDKELIDNLNNKKIPFIEKGIDSLLNRHVSKKFIPTQDNEIIRLCKYVMITLGTPVDEHLNPDYTQIDSILPILNNNLSKGQVIALRSTVAPGTTELIKDYLEKNSGLKAGKDFFLAFCPERIAEGNALEEISEIPQIIGGVDEESSEMAKEIFSKITKECLVCDAKSAELAKIFTNMYRYINFAIANEFAILAMENKKNIYDILHLANKNYKRGKIPMPGLTAGPCLYKDGFFILDTVPFNELISLSWRINENFPIYLVNKIKEIISLKGKKVAILGMAFKKNIDDTRNSLSFKLKKAIAREQGNVVLYDPLIEKYNSNLEEVLKNANVVLIAVNHDNFSDISIDFLKKHVAKGCILCDVWDITKTGKIISIL